MLLCATTVVLAWAAPWRASLRPSRPATIALAALAGLGVWAALSALWSPAPDVAIDDGQRILTYALAFGLGIWLCNLLGSRLHLALVPLAVAGAFAGIVAVIGMLTGDHVAALPRARRDARVPARLPQRERGLLRDRVVAGAGAAVAPRQRLARARRRAGDRDALPRPGDAEPEPRLAARPARSRSASTLLFATDRARGWPGSRSRRSRRCSILPPLIDLYQRRQRRRPPRSALDELHAAGATRSR